MIKTKDLKTNYWRNLIRTKQKPIYRYDEMSDAFFIYFSNKETEKILTHYVDEYFAFLFRYNDKEIIGIRIEDFQKGFVPLYTNKVWKLSETGEKVQAFVDLNLCYEKKINKKKETFIPIDKSVDLEPVFA